MVVQMYNSLAAHGRQSNLLQVTFSEWSESKLDSNGLNLQAQHTFAGHV